MNIILSYLPYLIQAQYMRQERIRLDGKGAPLSFYYIKKKKARTNEHTGTVRMNPCVDNYDTGYPTRFHFGGFLQTASMTGGPTRVHEL